MLKFGWSSKIISMDGPVLIIGQAHERISEGILDENTVTALCIDDGSTVSFMVSADVVVLSDGIIFEIREAVRELEPEIDVNRIMMSATHTHTSPRYQRVTGYDLAPKDRVTFISPQSCREFLVNTVAETVVEAYRGRMEGSYSYGYGYAVVSHHRRPTYFDDLRLRPDVKGPIALTLDKHARMYGKTNDPMFRGYEGNVDSTVYVMLTFDRDGAITGAVINVPCPSQSSEIEHLLSADYWDQVRSLIREKFGNIFILPQCANAGDMAPRTLHAKAAESRRHALKFEGIDLPRLIRPWEMLSRMDIAERIFDAFCEVYSWAQKEKFSDGVLRHTVLTPSMPAWKITEEQYLAAKEEYALYSAEKFVNTDDPLADFKKNTTLSGALSKFLNVIDRYESGRESYPAELHVISLGDIAFFSSPFELYISYQHRIQARSPFVQTFGVQLAASVGAAEYLCTPEAAENMGYSANIYSCLVSPEGGDIIVEEVLDALNKHKSV